MIEMMRRKLKREVIRDKDLNKVLIQFGRRNLDKGIQTGEGNKCLEVKGRPAL